MTDTINILIVEDHHIVRQGLSALLKTVPGLAVAALVCGLLGWIPFWIGFILCLLAITFSTIVLASTQPGRPGRGLAITGLVCGLVLLLPAACGL